MNIPGCLKAVKKYTDFEELPPVLLRDLTEKRVVHAPDKPAATAGSRRTATTPLWAGSPRPASWPKGREKQCDSFHGHAAFLSFQKPDSWSLAIIPGPCQAVEALCRPGEGIGGKYEGGQPPLLRSVVRPLGKWAEDGPFAPLPTGAKRSKGFLTRWQRPGKIVLGRCFCAGRRAGAPKKRKGGKKFQKL